MNLQPREELDSRVLGTLDEIEAVAAAWRELEAECADPLGYFQSYDWCCNWIREFCGQGTHKPYVVTLRHGDVLVALWPLMIVEAAGLKRLETLGAPHSQYCGALVRRGYASAAQIAKQMRDVVRASECDVSVLRAVVEGTALSELVAGDSQVRGTENVASMLDLSAYGSVEDYTAQLGKLQKRNRNRRRNHLARLGPLHFEVIWPDHAEFSTLVRQCTEMKRRWLAETHRLSAGFSMQGYEDFLARLGGDEAELNGACLSVLRAGDQVVAMELGFIQQRHYYAYIGGFDWDLRNLSPGKVQMDMTVGWLIENGVQAYDLLINPADYKASWTNRSLAVTTRAQALSWKGRIYTSAWLPRVRPALKWLHGRIPAWMERVSTLLRPTVCLLLYV
ncbi:CelD/BcsL family acetyltransferase involved in cellulose biosynthesis [Devosia subaequoris]|uniref:CelD/BcsL family acetyltransferase involved in cellulose biosynthesis n=1 Tax=Devosia subaequoris TaxID=395930 RepID=A0A7W6ILJ4_9HYPH|nr:GNAT family N-acetyltransferase [Devosia subaequoris]MBB4051799.1 CelD/BcsL family acetyltransferase involved in cellulose biosynthesis [Devosia subaequoris]MCP1210958.1 GNAT family N-acetyltransferase [Devosia subaequoris]